jgi:hypothetical protein
LFYPVIGAFFAAAALIIIILYPFCRNKYHHGVYDPFDILLSHLAQVYLQFVNFVLLCCKWPFLICDDVRVILRWFIWCIL